jgi:hypothetical protein
MHVQNTIKCSRTYNTPGRSCISVQSWPESTCCHRSVPWAKCHLSCEVLPTLDLTFRCDILTGAASSADTPSDWYWWSGLQTLWWCSILWATVMIRTVTLFVGYLSWEENFILHNYSFQLTATVLCQYNRFSNMFRLIHATIIRENIQGSYLVKNI